ncbi:hypothetical protein [Nocardioides limicola]|uniref:hypothetical protein n=1 Tax=Nocardioides limicola TaxID=2803368 RepID=UPI00193C45E2|nr:hypothetical protein [Nocardioides sp. DJM-14]
MFSARALASYAGGLVAVVLLAGCGGLNPGVAVKVGDDRVLLADVDRLATALCELQEEQMQAQGAQAPMAYVRAEAMFRYFLKIASAQYAADHGLSVEPSYDASLLGARADLERLPEELRDVYAESIRGQAYTEELLLVAGVQLLGGDPDAVDPETVDLGVAQQTGASALLEWLTAHDSIEFDPRFGLGVGDLGLERVESGVSVAASEFARNAAADMVDPAWVASLPSDQRCG